MSKTSAELINEAASDIGALSPGEVLSAEDYDKLDAKLDGLLAQLNASEGVYIQDKDEIPDEAFISLASLLGNVAGPALVGTAVNDAAYQRDVTTLRRITAVRAVDRPLKTTYY